MSGAVERGAVEAAMLRGFIAAEGARTRREDETKIDELVAMLDEVARAAKRVGRKRPFVLVDAAAGMGYLGVMAAALVLADREPCRLVLVERDGSRLEAARAAAARLGVRAALDTHALDVADPSAYPAEASLVVALHACGDACDRVLDAAIGSGAKNLLVVPCCVGASTRGVALARRVHAELGLPDDAPIARRMLHALVDGERLLRLEAAGYEAEAVEFVPARITPYNVLLRARKVGEPVRAARAAESLARLRAR